MKNIRIILSRVSSGGKRELLILYLINDHKLIGYNVSRSAPAATDRAEAWPEELPLAKVRVGDGERQAARAQERLRGATPRPRSGAAAALCWSSREEIPHVQGKRNPSKTVGVARGHQRADRLKP